MIYVFINRYVRKVNNNLRLSAYKALVKQQGGNSIAKQFPIKAVQNEVSPKKYYNKVFENVLQWLREQRKLSAFTLVITTDNFVTPDLQSKYNAEGFTNLHFTTAQTNQNATLMTLKKQTAMKVNQFVRKQQQDAKRKHDAKIAKHRALIAQKQRQLAHKKHLQAIEHQRQVDIAKLIQKLHDSEEGMTKYFAEHHSVVINLSNLIHHRPISTTTQKQIDKIHLASKPSVSPQEENALANKLKELNAKEHALQSKQAYQSKVASQQANKSKQLHAQQLALTQQAQSTQKQTQNYNHSATNIMQSNPASKAPSNPNQANIGGRMSNSFNSGSARSNVKKLTCLLSTIDGLIRQPKHAHINSDDVKHWTSQDDQVYVPFILQYLLSHKYITGSHDNFKVQIGRYHGFF